MKKNNCRKKTGFTLAEVLITLSIVGIVAAITIPSLTQAGQEKANVTALKKVFSTLSNAYKLAEQEDGTPDNWNLADHDPSYFTYIKPYLNIAKDCTDGSPGCFNPGVYYKTLDGDAPNWTMDNANQAAVILADGTLLMGWHESSDCTLVQGDSLPLQNICGMYVIDVNGNKKPNQWGIDTFYLFLTKYGIVPVGTAQQTSGAVFADYCGNKFNGGACSGWVIYNENMDYIKCPNTLSWDGPTKCN